MECYTLNQRTLLLLTALVAVSLVLSFAGGYYSGLRNAPEPPPSKELAEELLTVFLEAPKQTTTATTLPETLPVDPGTPPAPIPVQEEKASLAAETGPVQLPGENETTVTLPTEEPRPQEIALSPPETPPNDEPESYASPTETTALPQTAPTPAQERETPAQPPIVGYSVQVGSFGEQENAEESVERWRRDGYPAFIYQTTSSSGRRWHTVRVGRYGDREQAAEMAERLRDEKRVQAVTVPLVQH